MFRGLDWTGLDSFIPVNSGWSTPDKLAVTDTISQHNCSYPYTHTWRLIMLFTSYNLHLTPHHLPLSTHHLFCIVVFLLVELVSSSALVHSDCFQQMVVMKWHYVWVADLPTEDSSWVSLGTPHCTNYLIVQTALHAKPVQWTGDK